VPKEDSPAPFIEADLCDVEQVAELVSRSEAVIHMGAIPGPRAGEEQVTFLNNSLSTYNIMMAAAQQVRRVVFSSSAFAMGWSDNPDAFVPRYLPLDEEHEPMPFETYGLSKQIGECIGAMVARSSETSVISLRFNNVVSPALPGGVPPGSADSREASYAGSVVLLRPARCG
jgi:nucleoside-diphosphate-sugar epimerase